MKKSTYYYLGLSAIGIIGLWMLFYPSHSKRPTGHSRDYAEIAQEGVIRVATEYNSISFYIDGDTVSGFHYELIEAFAQSKGLKTNIIPVMSFNERLEGLNQGTYDIIANNLLAISVLKDSLLLTSPIILSKQVLVQRKATGDDSLYIQSQLDLAGRTLHVVKGSPSILRIHNLGNEIGDTIYISEVDKYADEQLIALVAHGDIDYAVCDESIAKAAIDSLPQLDISTDISFTQFYSWAVSKQSPALLDSLNTWLGEFRKGAAYQQIYRKYYKEK